MFMGSVRNSLPGYLFFISILHVLELLNKIPLWRACCQPQFDDYVPYIFCMKILSFRLVVFFKFFGWWGLIWLRLLINWSATILNLQIWFSARMHWAWDSLLRDDPSFMGFAAFDTPFLWIYQPRSAERLLWWCWAFFVRRNYLRGVLIAWPKSINPISSLSCANGMDNLKLPRSASFTSPSSPSTFIVPLPFTFSCKLSRTTANALPEVPFISFFVHLYYQLLCLCCVTPLHVLFGGLRSIRGLDDPSNNSFVF